MMSSPRPSSTTTGATRRFFAGCGTTCTVTSPRTSASAAAEDVLERRTRVPGCVPGELSGYPRRIGQIIVFRGQRLLRDVDADITAHHDVPQFPPRYRLRSRVVDQAQQDAQVGVGHHVIGEEYLRRDRAVR